MLNLSGGGSVMTEKKKTIAEHVKGVHEHTSKYGFPTKVKSATNKKK